MPRAPFTSLYRSLNVAQKKAVDAIEGPVMVIAGPGTGKTQILTLRIANILKKTDTPPHGILALTFTEAGVYAMRERLVSITGSAGYQVAIHTFHSFCNQLIERYPDQFPRIVGGIALSDIERIEFLRFAVDHTPLSRVRPFGNPYYYVRELSAFISELKRENLSPKKALELLLGEKEAFDAIDDLYHEQGAHKGMMKGKYHRLFERLERNMEALRVYEHYETLLTERRRFDYDDMIIEVIKTFQERPDFLLEVQEQYLYILADEHQDTNDAQNALLELLSGFHASPNLFLVGDAKQAIYRFQGASLENFLYFKQKFPDALVIHLTHNYRSHQTILDASHSLMLKANTSLSDSLSLHAARNDHSRPITIAACTTPEHEEVFIATSIRNLIGEGVPPDEIAVLFRTNADAASLSRALSRMQIPHVVESNQNVLEDDSIRAFIMLVEAIAFFPAEEKLAPLLFLDFLKLNPLSVYNVLRLRAQSHAPLASVMADSSLLKKNNIPDHEAWGALASHLHNWRQRAASTNALDMLDAIANDSGYIAALLTAPDGVERLEKYRALIRSVETRLATGEPYMLVDFVSDMALMREYRIPIDVSLSGERAKAVRLMTAHKSKGLEFDYVYIARALDEHWGNRKSRRHFTVSSGSIAALQESDIDDERRLFYVALTRGRHHVTISYATEYERGKPRLPTQFLAEIATAHVEHIDTDAFELSLSPEVFVRPVTTQPRRLDERAYVRSLFLEQGFSATSLNKYINDPWEYFFVSLLRLPSPRTVSLHFGTAVHAALREIFARYQTDKRLQVNVFLAAFTRHIEHLPISNADKASLLRKKASLEKFIKYHERSLTNTTIAGIEQSIQIPFVLDDGVSIPLRGTIDRMDIRNDGSCVVVDYKTGTPKSKSEIDGTTKGASGDYRRQMIFYKLLLDHKQDPALCMDRGELVFVEPDKRGVFRTHILTVTDEEVNALSTTLRRIAREICEGIFFDTPPKTHNNRYADLARLFLAE